MRCKKACLGAANLPHRPWFLRYTPTSCKFSYLFQDMESAYQVVQNNIETHEYETKWFWYTYDNMRNILIFQFSSVAQPCLTLCNPMDYSMPGLPVHHQLPEFTQTHVHWVGDAIQPSHPLSSPSPPAPNPSQHQSLFKWVSSLHQMAKVLEFQSQHQPFQWIFRTDFL